MTLVYEEILLAILFDNEGMLPDLETDLDQIISEDKQDSIEFIYEDIRNYQALEIEKIIWIALYYKSMDMINPGYDMNQVEDPGVIKGVDNDDRHLLQNYWWARFPDPDTSLPFKNKYKLFAHFKEVYSFLQDFDIEKVITPEN